MKKLRRNFERFCIKHRNFGISNLMLFIAIGTALVYLMCMSDPSGVVQEYLIFNRKQILQGQVWRLISFIFVPTDTNMFFLAISLYFYYVIGRAIEAAWGTFRFNLFYLCGVILTDVAGLLLPNVYFVFPTYLNLSLLLAFATLYPDNQVLLFFIIPLKMKYLAWFYFALTIMEVIDMNFFPLFALLNYFLFFGSDILQVLPDFMRPRGKSRTKKQKPNPNWAKDYQKKSSQPLYRHKCTICGKTDVSHPDLEFRYCSKCSGYHCYCMDHISNHSHITD